MKIRKVVISMIVIIMTTVIAFANSSPIYLSEYPSFSIAPMKENILKVEKEKLKFEISERSSSDAMVTAEYILTNPSDENVVVPMIFPYVSNGYNGLKAEIKLNGKEIPYEVYSAGHVDVKDYLKNPEDFNRQVNINTIIKNFNRPSYEPKYFNDKQNVAIYEVTTGKPIDRRAKVSFKIDPSKTRILTLNFSGLKIDSNGEYTVSRFVGKNSQSEKSYILVLGEETISDIKITKDDKIIKSKTNIRNFIMKNIIEDKDNWRIDTLRNQEDFYSDYIQGVDKLFESNQIVHTEYDIIEEVMQKNNILVLLYEAEFSPNSNNSLKVTYPMEATIDRENTNHYINTYAYILNPARNFSEFGAIDIELELSDRAPYIINSSIPFTEINKGIYRTSLEGIPERDLVFSTYPKEKITFMDKTTAQILPRGYLRMVIVLIFLVVFSILILGFIIKRLKVKDD